MKKLFLDINNLFKSMELDALKNEEFESFISVVITVKVKIQKNSKGDNVIIITKKNVKAFNKSLSYTSFNKAERDFLDFAEMENSEAFDKEIFFY